MYSVSVGATFNAIHRVRLPDGSLEPLHGHDWAVRVWFESPNLDPNGMVVDFDAARAAIESVVSGLHHTDLAAQEALSQCPTAERVARYVFDQLHGRGWKGLCRVEVSESPGCLAAYESG